jgi:hypothetical protein
MKGAARYGYDRGMEWQLKSLSSALLVAVLVLLGGCQSAGVTRVPVAPPLQLTSSAPLQLPASCESHGSVVVEFTVLPDGATTGIQTPAVPECLHAALTAWVASFRYAPPGVSLPGTLEWLLVSARKGS